MKSWLVVSIVAVIFAGALVMSCYTDPSCQCKQDTAHQVGDAVVPVVCPEQRGNKIENPKSLPYPCWNYFFTWPNGITALAIICTLLAIIWQSSQTQKAAEAARSNAQFLIDSERAWMIGTPDMKKLDPLPEPGAKFIYKCVLRNVGKTPAKMIQTGLAFKKVNSVGDIPQTPIYEKTQMQSINKFLVIPEGSCSAPHDTYSISVDSEITSDEFVAVKKGTGGILYAYGFVKYLDSFDREHETHFCHYYHVPGPYDIAKEGFHVFIDAPSEYNKAN
jgi:hypothetical protein